MSHIYKLFFILLAVLGFVTYDFLYAEPIEDLRIFNLVIELTFAFLAVVLFISIGALKGKSFYKFLNIGFFMVFVSMLVDGLDQLHWHGEIYTALWEKTTLLTGFVLVFIGMKTWIVDHGQMNKKLESQAYTDELTGLYNRRGMLKKFEAMNEQAVKHNLTLSFIIADIDDFKEINDTMGHVSGDAYLADLGQSLLSMANNQKVIGRWGGEEFAICMLGSDLNQALGFSEQIRQTVINIPMPPQMKKQHMTVSLGVSQKRPQERLMDALRRADRSLYSAKNKGKNQSVAD